MKLESSIQLSPEDILLKEIRDLKAAVTTLQTENAALKTDVSKAEADITALKARQISVTTKTNNAQASGTVVVKCDAGTSLMTCANNSNASGTNVSKTTAITNTQCTCNVTGGSGFGLNLNRIQAVNRINLFFIFLFTFLTPNIVNFVIF